MSAQAQNDTSPPPGAILFINQERMLIESTLGRAILVLESEERAVLTAASEAIADELAAEETELTELRKTATPEDFRIRAEAFNLRVERVRAEQLEKDRAQTQRNEDRRRAFFGIAAQVLGDIMVQNRASAIMDRRSVLLFNTSLDITDLAVSRLDTAYAEDPALLPTDP
ncbi:MAG: OmpH family outer membrane protein [Paracoccaceae bacterium]